MTPRRALIAVLALAAGVAASTALSQSTIPITISVDAHVIPDKAGTPTHPQPIRIDTKVHVHIPQAYDPPLVDTVDVWFPRGGLYNGAKWPSCSASLMARRGVKACPKGAIFGHGSGKASADTVYTYPKITVVNGGATRVYFYTVLNNPARVESPVAGILTKPGGKWSYKLHTRIPKVLQIVAGIPIILRELHVAAGSIHKDWIASTSCPSDHKWNYHVLITFTTGQTKTYDNYVRCR